MTITQSEVNLFCFRDHLLSGILLSWFLFSQHYQYLFLHCLWHNHPANFSKYIPLDNNCNNKTCFIYFLLSILLHDQTLWEIFSKPYSYPFSNPMFFSIFLQVSKKTLFKVSNSFHIAKIIFKLLFYLLILFI